MPACKYLIYLFAIVMVSGWTSCRSTDPFSHQLVPIHDVIVPAGVASGFIFPVYDGVDQSDVIWGVFHGDEGRFILYDVLQQSIEATVELPGVAAAPHHFQGSLTHRDTFLLLDLNQHQLLKLTHSGDTAAIWQLPFSWNEYGAITYNAVVPAPINQIRGTYYLSLRSMEWDLSHPTGGLYEAPLLFSAAGPDPEHHKALGKWPLHVKDPDNFALDLMPKLSRPFGDTIFYSFYSDPHVYAFDIGALKATAVALPADAYTTFSPMQLSMLSDISATSVFGVENSLYGGLTYDPFRKVIYRIVLHALPLEREDGMEHLMEDKPWSIQIIDARTMKELGEAAIPDAATYLPRAVYPTPEGVLIQKRAANSPADGATTFTLFSVVH